jgi:hypothetical protein
MFSLVPVFFENHLSFYSTNRASFFDTNIAIYLLSGDEHLAELL